MDRREPGPWNTLAIDFGSKYIGIALVSHPAPLVNRVLYAATVVVEAKPLNALVESRAGVRRIRRTRKTHQRRLRRLSQALAGIAGAGQILRFCRRRGFSYDASKAATDETAFHVHRAEFFRALRDEIARVIAPADRERVEAACSRHLNETCRKVAELRPARFENRGPTKCNWQRCNHNVPRSDHAVAERLQQSLFVWMKPVFDASGETAGLRRSVEHWIAELASLASAYQGTGALEKDQRKTARAPLNKRKSRVFKNLLDRVAREARGEASETFKANWTEHYRAQVSEIIQEPQAGRARYCRTHSAEFADFFLAGKQIPNKTEITAADLVSRKQQIVFERLWRLVQARVLPLAGGRIDRVIVERVAFDVLAGPFKARQQLPETKAAEMYWSGPQLGFSSRREMLAAEFGGLCAYCGERTATDQVEHLFPASAFPFDSYFNVVPACATCNAHKGARSPAAAAMTISSKAYEAYSDYVRGLRVPHVYHTVKKGLLNLLQRPGSVGQAERMLGMLANDLVRITRTQQSPRPLARYLVGKIKRHTGNTAEIVYRAGRHTALYRSAMLPDYDKYAAKDAADLRNHAVDAIVLACELPSAAALENRHWNGHIRDIQEWFDKVRAASPPQLEGLPRVEPVDFIPYFEVDLGSGYCRIDLSAFNWNRRRKATHGLDPFGVAQSGLPLKHVSASTVLAKLRDPKHRASQIDAIAHAGLRRLLRTGDETPAAERFIHWLQQTCSKGLAKNATSSHPADQARIRLLREFVLALTADVMAETVKIPWTIGVRCVNKGAKGQLDIARIDDAGHVVQRYQSEAVVREMYVGYRADNSGTVNRTKPVLYFVDQAHRVRYAKGSKKVAVQVAEGSPLMGRPFGSRLPLREFGAEWTSALHALFKSDGIVDVFRVSQGCVIEKTDGTRFQLGNFDKGQPWMKAGAFQNIARVIRSPLRAMVEASHISDACESSSAK